MIVYGRNAVREALRGRRATSVGEVWATHGAAREPWLTGVERQIAARRAEIERRCGSPRAPGGLRARPAAIRTSSAERAAGRARAADRRARRGAGPAEPRLDLPHRRVRRGERRGDLRAPRRRGDAGGRARPRPARSSTCGSRACATSPTSCSRRARRAAGATAPAAERERSAYDRARLPRRRGRDRVRQPRVTVCARASPALRRARRAAAARTDRLAERERRRRGDAVRDVANACEAGLDKHSITAANARAHIRLNLRFRPCSYAVGARGGVRH